MTATTHTPEDPSCATVTVVNNESTAMRLAVTAGFPADGLYHLTGPCRRM